MNRSRAPLGQLSGPEPVACCCPTAAGEPASEEVSSIEAELQMNTPSISLRQGVARVVRKLLLVLVSVQSASQVQIKGRV